MSNSIIEKKGLARTLYHLRLSNSYNQSYVAKHLGISRQSYWQYEHGICVPETRMLIRLAEFYHLPLSDFIELAQQEDSSYKEESVLWQDTSIDFTDFISYFSLPENIKKYGSLNRQEKEILYYFQKMDSKNKQDILLFAHIKAQNNNCSMNDG